MTRRLLPPAILLLVAAGALAIRLPRLALRPLHGDEAVEAFRTGRLYDEGFYRYDPREYHGPTLHYATLPFLWLSGARSFAESSEVTFRLVDVGFGVGLILLLLLLADGLGWPATLAAAALTAISPAMVFYNRYYIHESPLVFFTLAAIASAWRYTRCERPIWAILAGASLALMHATKETCVLAFAAMALALLADLAWRKLWGEPATLDGLVKGWHVAGAIAAGLVVSFVLFSSFFTNWRGPLDSILSFGNYLQRSGGAGIHDKPWHYYLGLLGYARSGRGAWWSEALILALAVIGLGAGLCPRRLQGRAPLLWFLAFYGFFLTAIYALTVQQTPKLEIPQLRLALAGVGVVVLVLLLVGFAAALRGEARSILHRFLAFYITILTCLYAAVPYKTPWCMMSFLHGMILLAGLGAVALIRVVPTHLLKVSASLLLAAAAWQLAGQACRASLDRRWVADRRNPYVYAHTVPDLLEIPHRAEQIAALHPLGRQMVIKVIAPDFDYWPLPFYLRRFPRCGYWPRPDPTRPDGLELIPADPEAEMIIASTQVSDELEKRLRGQYFTETRGLRPAVHLQVYIRRDLWDAFLKRQAAPGPQP